LENNKEILGKNDESNWFTRLVITGNIFWSSIFSIIVIVSLANTYILDRAISRNKEWALAIIGMLAAFLLVRLFLGKMFSPNPFLQVTKEHYPQCDNVDLYDILSYAVPKNKKFIVKGFYHSDLCGSIKLHYQDGIYIVFINSFIKAVFDKSPEIGRQMIITCFGFTLLSAQNVRLMGALERGLITPLRLSYDRDDVKKQLDAGPSYEILDNSFLNKILSMWFSQLLIFPLFLISFPGYLISKTLISIELALNVFRKRKYESIKEILFPIGTNFKRAMDPTDLREVDLIYWAFYPKKKPNNLEKVSRRAPTNITLEQCYEGKASFAPLINFLFNCGLKCIFALALLAFDICFYYLKFLGYEYDLPYVLMIGFPIGLVMGYRFKESDFNLVEDPRPLDPQKYELIYKTVQYVVPRGKFLIYRRHWNSSETFISHSYDKSRRIYLVLIDAGIIDAFDANPRAAAEYIKYTATENFRAAYLSRFWEQACYIGLHPLLERIKEGINESYNNRGYVTKTYVIERAYTDFRSNSTRTVTDRESKIFDSICLVLIYPYIIVSSIYIMLSSFLSLVVTGVPKKVIQECDSLYRSLPSGNSLTMLFEPEQYDKMNRKERKERKEIIFGWYSQFK